jgi:hypothetical protein
MSRHRRIKSFTLKQMLANSEHVEDTKVHVLSGGTIKLLASNKRNGALRNEALNEINHRQGQSTVAEERNARCVYVTE